MRGFIKGERDDIAYFAHFEDFDHDEVDPGQVIISVLRAGWSWRIPLPGRLSVGIVVSKEHAKTLGSTAEERMENALRQEPLLAEKAKRARRIMLVMTYSNYQLLADRGHGPGWVLCGDAFGFVDPMISPGLFMSLVGAQQLDSCLFAHGVDILNQPEKLARALNKYAARIIDWHRAWQELVRYFYDGHIFRIHLAGKNLAMKHQQAHISSPYLSIELLYLERLANQSSTLAQAESDTDAVEEVAEQPIQGHAKSKTKVVSAKKNSQVTAKSTKAKTKKTVAATQHYTVRSGDNLGKVAAKFGMSTAALKRLNHLEGDALKPGQKLVIAG